MIVNHKYKFIFIKSFKTAGTSLEIALSKFCSSEDIITPIVPKDEQIREKLGFTGPSNFHNGMKEHMTAKDLKEKIDPDIFNNYFKFVTVRNPFDQIISAYYWHNESKKNEKKFLFFKKKPISFDKFFSRKAHHIFKDEIERYTENSKILVDDFLKYETIENDLKKISQKLNLPENLFDVFNSIKAKSNINPPISERIKLNNTHVTKIKKLADKIINLHGYKYQN